MQSELSSSFARELAKVDAFYMDQEAKAQAKQAELSSQVSDQPLCFYIITKTNKETI